MSWLPRGWGSRPASFGLLVGPEATVTLPDGVRIVPQVLVFGAVSLTLIALGRRGLAKGLAVSFALNGIVIAGGPVSLSSRLGRRTWMTVEAQPA
jgi:hypothetical protein